MKRSLTPARIGNRIREIREGLGLSQEAFAKAIRVPKQYYISRYEMGRVPDPDLLIKIARLGNVSIDWIFTGKHPNTEQKQTAA